MSTAAPLQTDTPRHSDAPYSQADLSSNGFGYGIATAIVGTAAGLMAIGAVMAFSASAGIGGSTAGESFWQGPVFRQLVFTVAGLAAMLAMTGVRYRLFAAWQGLPAAGLLAGALGLAGLVFVPGIGVEVNQAWRWIRIGPASWGLRAQPSELLKLALPIFLAAWATRGYRRARETSPDCSSGTAPMERWLDIRSFWRGLLPAVVAIGLAVLVVGIEDFGTAALLAAVGGAMLLMAGARWWHLMLLVLPAVPAFGYLLVSRSHRMERILTFMDIWRDPDGKGYQAIQSLCTIASGGWWGRGAGQGFSKTYLPEARTDFIFAVIYEEWGMLGAVAVVGLFLAMLWLAGWVICRCQDPFGRLLVFGLALMIGMQAAINVAVVTVMAPTKGIALPMVSAGGSGAIVLGAIVGLMASVAWRCGSCRDSQQKSE